MDLRYTSRYSSVNLKLINADNPKNGLLRAIICWKSCFWNIWLNAHQAAGLNCSVTVIFETPATIHFENTGQRPGLLEGSEGHRVPTDVFHEDAGPGAGIA